jgi:tetratricopeptide (TPR) repeat protein
LGGHPLALTVAAANLRNRHGVQSYVQYAATLEPDKDVLNLVSRAVGLLDPDERIIVELAGLLDSQPLPAGLIEGVLSAVGGSTGQLADAGRALDRLDMLGLARREGTWWHIHPLVSDAARRSGSTPAVPAALAFSAARGILSLGESPAGGPSSAADVVRLARTLGASPALRGTAEADLLRELMARHYEALGDVVEAAGVRRLLAAAQPSSLNALTTAALACNACGDYDDAADLAHQALRHERAFPALWALADALDGLARYSEADDLWRELDATDMPPQASGAQRVAYEVARARAHLARGQLREASILLKAIRARHAPGKADNPAAHDVNSATVLLAIHCLQTGRETEGRRLASSVVDFYRDRNAEKHATCLAAELAWAEAAVSLPLFEMNPDKRSWADAEQRLRRLYDSYRESAGSDSVLTMTIAVQLALILARVGKHNTEVIEMVESVIPAISARLGEKHPLWLRSQYILGLAHLRQNEFEDAHLLLETAWVGQKQVLGPRHPETLSTQLEFGVILKLYDAKRSRQLIFEVLQVIPDVAGRRNFNYGRAFFASTLLQALPGPAVRRFWELSNQWEYKDQKGS